MILYKISLTIRKIFIPIGLYEKLKKKEKNFLFINCNDVDKDFEK